MGIGSPNQYDFGLEFNFALWIPGTTVDLVNVPWDNNYRDVVKFSNKAALNTYIDGRRPSGIVINQLSYVKPGEPVRVDIPHTRALKYNYLRASNPLQPIEGDEQKVYYYFILDARYIAPNTTELVLQLDIFQTYGYDVTFGNCYIERGHIGIANSNAFNAYGRDYLTIPEGFDVGNEYMVAAVRDKWVMSPTPWQNSTRYPSHDVLVVSTVDLSQDPGTAAAPSLKSATGTDFQGTSQGAEFYIFDAQQFGSFLAQWSEYPWITQGIVSVTMIPKISRYNPEFNYSEEVAVGAKANTIMPRNIGHDLFTNWRNHPDYVNYIPERYRHLDKMKVYPYTVIEMTTFNATPIALKPEAWNDANARILERAALVPPGARVEFSPRFYNSRINSETESEVLWPSPVSGDRSTVRGDDYGDYLDLVTQIANFPTSSIVNNGQIAYLAANVHGIAYQRSSADWSQNRALGMAQGQYDVATSAMHTMMNLSGSGVNADIANTANLNRTQAAQAITNATGQFVHGVGQAVTPSGLLGGAISGTANAAQTAINAGIGIGSNDEGLAIRNRLAQEQVTAQNKQSQVSRDTNKDLADWAAKGDYSNAISGINAKVQDAALIQPTTSGQIGGESVNMINGGWKVSLRFKMIDHSAMRVVGEYWLRYGYAIRAFIQMPSSLMAMTKFTYWKLNETYIIASEMPEMHKQGLRGIFEKGVTVWADPDDIGQIDLADNEPLGGISY